MSDQTPPIKRKKGKDAMKEKYKRYGKYTQKGIRIKENNKNLTMNTPKP